MSTVISVPLAIFFFILEVVFSDSVPPNPNRWTAWTRNVEEPVIQLPLSATVISTTVPTTVMILPSMKDSNLEEKDLQIEDSRQQPDPSLRNVSPIGGSSEFFQSSCPVCTCNCPKCPLSDEPANPAMVPRTPPGSSTSYGAPRNSSSAVVPPSSVFGSSQTNQGVFSPESSSGQSKNTYNSPSWQRVRSQDPVNSLITQIMRGALQNSGLGYLFESPSYSRNYAGNSVENDQTLTSRSNNMIPYYRNPYAPVW